MARLTSSIRQIAIGSTPEKATNSQNRTSVKTVALIRSMQLQHPKRINPAGGRVYAGAPVIA
jgi:hypothetical protein